MLLMRSSVGRRAEVLSPFLGILTGYAPAYTNIVITFVN
jgi:hypothetical protein